MFNELEEVIRNIKDDCGNDIFLKKDILINVYYDFGSHLPEKVERLFKLFVGCNGFEVLLNMSSDSNVEVEIQKIVVLMSDKVFVEQQIIKEFCIAVYKGLNQNAQDILNVKKDEENKKETNTKTNTETKQKTEEKKEEFYSQQNFFNSQPVKKSKNKLVIFVILIFAACGLMFVSMNSYSSLMKSAAANFEKEKYDVALSKYAKAVSKSKAEPEAYVGLAQALGCYYETSENVNNELIEKLGLDVNAFMDEAVSKFPDNASITEANNHLKYIIDLRNKLISASQMESPAEAENLYNEVLSESPNFMVAKMMYKYNHAEKLLAESSWAEMDTWMRNEQFSDSYTFVIQDQKTDYMEGKQYGLYLCSSECYLGDLDGEYREGQGIFYKNYGLEYPDYKIITGLWSGDQGNGQMTLMKKNRTTKEGDAYEMSYHGNVIDDCFDGNVAVWWTVNVDGYIENGSGNMTVNNGTVVPVYEETEDGEIHYYYINKDQEYFTNWYITEDWLNDFDI